MAGNFRSRFEERDKSSFVKAQTNEVGGMVIKSAKGPSKPVLCQDENDIITYFGEPSSTYPEVFEAIAFVSQAPLYISGALGDNSKWGGVHVSATEVVGFGAGQDDPDDFSYTTANQSGLADLGVGDGTANQNFSGTFNALPVDEGSIVIKVGGTAIDVIDDDGVFSGTKIDPSGTNTVDYNTGAYDFTLSGITPLVTDTVQVEFGYVASLESTISHSFFTRSPYADDLKIKIKNLTGSQFHMTLYQTVEGNDVYITEYDYSLLKEKNAFGKNLYIMDIFDDHPYLIPKLNANYPGAIPALTETLVTVSGGKRGESPTTGQYTTGWNWFQNTGKYKAKIFMDNVGNSAGTLNTLINTYSFYAHGISVVPLGNNVADAVSFRSSLSIDSDAVSLYTNWRKIYDPYNDSFAWISNVGSIGKKFAQMENVYDGLSPAGIDENDHGGQIGDWTTIEMEYDYTEGTNGDLKTLDDAQICPVIFDELYGVMIYGDKTLQVSLSDTSYVATRRIYNYIIETTVKQVLRRQEFKNNDGFHQLKAKSMTETFLTPIITKELLQARVICDDSNNTADVLERRDFILDVIVKGQANSQNTLLRLTRVSQTEIIADVIPQ